MYYLPIFIYLYYVCGVCTMPLFLFWNRVLICCTGWPGTHYEAKCNLRLTAILSLLPVHWVYNTMFQFLYFIAPKEHFWVFLKNSFIEIQEVLCFIFYHMFHYFYFICLCNLSPCLLWCIHFYYLFHSLYAFKAYCLVPSFFMLYLSITNFTSLKFIK